MGLSIPVSNKLAVVLLVGILAAAIPVAASSQNVAQALIELYTKAKEDLIGAVSSISSTRSGCSDTLRMINATLAKADSLIESAETSMNLGNYHQAESLVLRAINMIGKAYQSLYKCGIAEGSVMGSINSTIMGQLNRTQVMLSKVMNVAMRANSTVNVTPVMEHLREAERLMKQATSLLSQNRTKEAMDLMAKVEAKIRKSYEIMEKITERERKLMEAMIPRNATIVNMSGAPEEVMEKARKMIMRTKDHGVSPNVTSHRARERDHRSSNTNTSMNMTSHNVTSQNHASHGESGRHGGDGRSGGRDSGEGTSGS